MNRINNLNSKTYLLVLVALLAAIGPFVTDFYLPAFPKMTTFFGTNASMIQLSLTFCMAGLAVGQIFVGPLSDKLGRKKPLLICILFFIISTIACIFAWNIESFIISRFIQGLSGSGGIVISKSIVVDNYEGKEMGRFFSILSIIQAIAPISAPMLGGLLLNITDWRGIFVTLVFIELIIFCILIPFKETLPQSKRVSGKLINTFKGYPVVLKNKKFMSFTMVQAFTMGVTFAYIGSSPFIFQQSYGLSPIEYSLCFMVNSVAIMIGSALSNKFSSPEKALVIGSKILLIMGCLFAIVLGLKLPFLILEIVLFVFLVSQGLLLPTSSTLALSLERNNSGNTSAVFGCISFFVAGIASPLTGIGDMHYSTGIVTVLFCVIIASCVFKTLGFRNV